MSINWANLFAAVGGVGLVSKVETVQIIRSSKEGEYEKIDRKENRKCRDNHWRGRWPDQYFSRRKAEGEEQK